VLHFIFLCAFFRCLRTLLFGSTFILIILRAPRLQLYRIAVRCSWRLLRCELCYLNAQDSNCRIWVNVFGLGLYFSISDLLMLLSSFCIVSPSFEWFAFSIVLYHILFLKSVNFVICHYDHNLFFPISFGPFKYFLYCLSFIKTSGNFHIIGALSHFLIVIF